MLFFTRWKAAAIVLTALVVCLFALPNFFSDKTVARFPDWAQRHIVLGLDLQGGSSLLLQVDTSAVRHERLQGVDDDVLRVLRQARIPFTGRAIVGNSVQVHITRPEDVKTALDKLGELSQPLTGIAGTTGQRSLDIAENGGLITLTPSDAALTDRIRQAVDQSIEIIQRRVNELGLVEPSIQREGVDRILVQVPGLQDPTRLKEILGKTAKLDFRMLDLTMTPEQALATHPPADSEVLDGQQPGEKYLVEKRVLVSGADLVDAEPGFDQRTNEPVVNFRFNSNGARKFAEATQQNVGKPFAIVLDNQVVSAPVIREPILGGQGQISGNFTVQQANDLAILLRAGALPAPLTIVQENTVGPGLGQDSIRAGEHAAFVGAGLVIFFMLVTYGLFGLFANIAVAVNVAMIFGVLSMLGATLTLPGIAGIVLTVGIAVDSNVLIYERIREEVRAGRTAINAIDAGFTRALATILDSNITTFIAAAVLFYAGSGPVRGFAVTLGIGILTSLFTAFTLTRLIVAYWVRLWRPRTVPLSSETSPVPLLRIVPDNTRFDFMRFRRISFPISAMLSIAAILLYFFHGLNFGIDFVGGTLVEVQTKASPADLAKMRATISGLNLGEFQLQQFGAPDDVLIRISEQPGGDPAQEAAVQKVRNALGDTVTYRRVEVVGPSVSTELLSYGTIGLLGAIVAILFYLWFRFEWQFALGAMIANVHDVVLTVGFMSLTRVDFDLTSIAALLTIVGYSLNDTVVIYDRIREMLRRYKRMSMPDLLNISVNATLSRSIVTHLTVACSLLALLLFGGQAIRSFTATMMFGVVLVGTYTSVFIASPILIYLGVGLGRMGGAEEPEIPSAQATEKAPLASPPPSRPAPARRVRARR